MLKYCAWCGKYQGANSAQGYQIRKNVCEIDTATICPGCYLIFLHPMRALNFPDRLRPVVGAEKSGRAQLYENNFNK